MSIKFIHTPAVRLDEDLEDLLGKSQAVFAMRLTGESIQEFKEILSRGLNTAPPEKWADWIKVSDALANVCNR